MIIDSTFLLLLHCFCIYVLVNLKCINSVDGVEEAKLTLHSLCGLCGICVSFLVRTAHLSNSMGSIWWENWSHPQLKDFTGLVDVFSGGQFLTH